MIAHPPAQVRPGAETPASRVLGSVLARIRADGALPDSPGGAIVNADSNYLYLLTGLAGQAQRSPALWRHVENGLRWLSLRRWGPADPLPGAFPDALPLEGPGRPMGSPATAAVGATAARFVALVGQLPHPAPDLVQAAREAWAGLLAWNWVAVKGMRNAWELGADGRWQPREVWYAADQADYAAGRQGALRLGLVPAPPAPWPRFSPDRLALDGAGRVLALPAPGQAAALAILAFDGPPAWRPRVRLRLVHLEAEAPGYILPLTARAYLGDPVARRRLLLHLEQNPMPLDQERPGSPVYTPVAGFVLRLFATP